MCMRRRSAWVRGSGFLALACLLAACSATSSPESTNPSSKPSVADSNRLSGPVETPPDASHAPVADASPITVPNESPVPAGSGTIYDTAFGCPTDNSVWLNLWQARSRDRSLGVCAGAVADDPRQGLVLWVESGPPPAFANLIGKTLSTPQRDGAVRVTAAAGDILTLTTADGSTFTFDAGNGAFR